MELAPKPKHGSMLSVLDVIRVSMQRLAGDWIWQYICATGRSGTKMSMSSKMPQIMDIILLTACKILSVDPKQAMTALSVYLKNTSTRASAKKHRQKFEIGGCQNVSISVENGRAELMIADSEGSSSQASCNVHSGGTDPFDSSDGEVSPSLLSLPRTPSTEGSEIE